MVQQLRNCTIAVRNYGTDDRRLKTEDCVALHYSGSRNTLVVAVEPAMPV
jgi:hypothetical protein